MASSFSKANSKLRKTFSSAILSPPRETHQKIARKQKSYYERLTYFLDILVADDEPDTMLVPAGSIMQHVKYGKNDRWRVIKDENGVLPAYLVDHRPKDPDYVVPVEDAGIFPIFDLTSNFLKRWDMLSLILLLFTASVTPFETAFIHNDTGIDLLWLINRCVDIVFFLDMFVQIRTPYRDQQTGRLVRDGKAILSRYVKSWFLIDLLSIIPFEMINQSSGSNSKNLSQLRLLRFLRLARLLKLLRVLRASRKLKQWRVYINLRYATLKLVQFSVIILFMIHWIACGYRLAEDPNDPSDPQGWLSNYANYRNVNITSLGIMEPYILALYWASSTITLVGPSFDQIAPTTVRETGYSLFANFVAYFLALYLISSLTNVLSVANRLETEHDLRVDNYLEMFQRLKLDPRLKVKVHQYLSDHYAAAATQAYTNLLGELPAQLHGFITMEIFVDFIARVPYLEPFIDREPNLTHEICRGVLIQTIPANAHVFTEGYQGIYFLEHGIVAIDGRVYPSGSVFGRTCLRAFPKRNECRALTNVTIHYLPLTVLRSALSKYPKIMYYAKRWTVWQLLRRYVFTYTTLYYTAAKRGARMVPPLTSMRPGLREGEYDDIDLAVLEHINEFGY
ncbi:uncharacterized protein EV422DRAFT_501651 [Fimicolochytrium jonesii]|uniref:uncharacterized protein n=1 Tax=Fimicolochytrium jonesii TaxID=1396493 RepID=UPI0022FEC923|nr:uncharacterized protein EV422DRAFT_501651 [Fimicolochytrium jonesii]KAI8816090.1 hypothetical protein EV422DRAFT_501651 [Fimicolochytrium jonesii]